MQRGVIVPPCLHPTPHYYLGWAIEHDKLYKAYPDYHGGSFSNFWHARVIYPWKKHGGIYVTGRYVHPQSVTVMYLLLIFTVLFISQWAPPAS